jgi:hypothetical protein
MGKGRGNVDSKNLDTEKSGLYALSSKLLSVGLNFAIPEVDRGIDAIVFDRSMTDYCRVQVKSATPSGTRKTQKRGSKFKKQEHDKIVLGLQADRLDSEGNSDVIYVLVLLSSAHNVFLVFTRDSLRLKIADLQIKPSADRRKYNINCKCYASGDGRYSVTFNSTDAEIDVSNSVNNFELMAPTPCKGRAASAGTSPASLGA